MALEHYHFLKVVVGSLQPAVSGKTLGSMKMTGDEQLRCLRGSEAGVGWVGVVGCEETGKSMLFFLFFLNPVNSYSSFMTPLKFPLPWEAFLISKDCHPVLPLGIHSP